LSTEIKLGPLTERLKVGASWRDQYPAWQVYADECERLLEFVQARRELDRFWGRLIAKKQQRDEALNEIRLAYFLESLGYPVSAWEPSDAAQFNVDFSVDLGVGKEAFVEVKNPGGESELTHEVRRAGRAQRPKYIGIEGRAAGPIQIIRRTVEKARSKFTGRSPSLLVISDDCFVNLGNWGWGPLQMALLQNSIAWGEGLFRQSKYENIGAVGLFWVGKDVEYRSMFMANPNALPSAVGRSSMIAKLTTDPEEPSLHDPQQGTTPIR
jgi:hypothetical protein